MKGTLGFSGQLLLGTYRVGQAVLKQFSVESSCFSNGVETVCNWPIRRHHRINNISQWLFLPLRQQMLQWNWCPPSLSSEPILGAQTPGQGNPCLWEEHEKERLSSRPMVYGTMVIMQWWPPPSPSASPQRSLLTVEFSLGLSKVFNASYIHLRGLLGALGKSGTWEEEW